MADCLPEFGIQADGAAAAVAAHEAYDAAAAAAR
jgi:hypothetical protein